jgi:hypothetical protein
MKLLQTRNSEDKKQIEEDVEVLLRRSKAVLRRRDDLGLPPPGTKTETFSGVSQKLDVAYNKLQFLIQAKNKCLNNLMNHQKDICSQIIEQSDMAIRLVHLVLFS